MWPSIQNLSKQDGLVIDFVRYIDIQANWPVLLCVNLDQKRNCVHTVTLILIKI